MKADTFSCRLLASSLAALVWIGAAHAAIPASDPLGKVDPVLADLARQSNHLAVRAAQVAVRTDSAESAVLVVVETAVDGWLARASLLGVGARIDQVADSSTLAWVPITRMAAVAALPAVLRVRRPIAPTWDVVSEGVSISRADLTQATGARGMGVRVGVIDVFQGYESSLGGELPPRERVQFRSFIGGGGTGTSNHGVLVAEIVTDMAPDANLYLASIDDDVGFRNAIDWMITEGVHIINHSGGFGLFGDMRGDGPLHHKIAQATAANILYVEAAGNSALSHWEGNFTDADGNGQHEFASGIERLGFNVPAGADLSLRVDLTWDDWQPNPTDPRPTTDYDLCLYSAAGATLSCAATQQNGMPGEVPFEVLEFTLPATGDYALGVLRRQGGALHMELSLIPDFSIGAFNMPSSSIIAPADHPQSFTVGATGLDDEIRSYSSRGPTNDGRLKPEICASDGVVTSFGRFFGTSASCPHVAGAAAILKSIQPGLGANELRQRILDRVVQVPADTVAGPDNAYGYGRLDANFANGTTGATPTPTPTVTPTPRPSTSKGGGCRLAGRDGGARWSLLFSALLVIGYAAWLRRRHEH